MSRFSDAYSRSRYWHGDKNGNINQIAMTGLLTKFMNTIPGSSDPEYSGKGGGIICLGTIYGTSGSYGSTGDVARVFMNRTRGDKYQGNSAQAYMSGQFKSGDANLWRDTDNPQAVCTWADIPADWIWIGKLTDLCKRGDTDSKVVAIFGNIASFDDALPKDVASLKQALLDAVKNNEIADDVNEGPAKNPILGVGRAPPGPPSNAQKTPCLMMN